MCFIFHKAQLRCEECFMKTHIAQEVNKAQLEEVTQLTVNRILESALATATTMTCCSARRMNRSRRERARSDLITGASSKHQRLSLKLPKKKVLLAESSNRFAASVDEHSCEKVSESHRCRHR